MFRKENVNLSILDHIIESLDKVQTKSAWISVPLKTRLLRSETPLKVLPICKTIERRQSEADSGIGKTGSMLFLNRLNYNHSIGPDVRLLTLVKCNHRTVIIALRLLFYDHLNLLSLRQRRGWSWFHYFIPIVKIIVTLSL